MASVFVIGAGFMGRGIAQVCAQAGYDAFLTDADPAALKSALDEITWSVDKLAAKGSLAEDPAAVFGRVRAAEGWGPAAEADWIIEAAYEKEDLKHEIFRQADRRAKESAVIATNTSSIPITRLAAVVDRPERVVGLHFFGPVPLMPLVEVVRGEATSDRVFEEALAFTRSLGKTPVAVQKDIPMFVMNRVFSAAFNEAADLVALGAATAEDVDVGMRLGYGWAAGPFQIADNAGLDTFVLIFRAMQELEGRPPGPGQEMLERMTAEGRLGRKVGRGFYEYDEKGKQK